MNDKSFFDTNLIVYLFDESEKEKQKKANAVFLKCINEKNAFISVQVINEFIVIGTKKIKNPISFLEIEKRVRFLENRCYVSNLTIQDSYAAISIKNKYQLSFWDSLILQSALRNECKILYSEDMQHNQVIENTLKIINPFL